MNVIDDLDIARLDFWERPAAERVEAFAWLRRQERPLFFAQPKVPLARAGKGFYALVRHADVVEASRNAAVFANAPAVSNPEPPKWVKYIYGDSLENMDAPEHTRLRRIVSRAFAPRMMARLEGQMQRRAGTGVGGLGQAGAGGLLAPGPPTLPPPPRCGPNGLPRGGPPQVRGRGGARGAAGRGGGGGEGRGVAAQAGRGAPGAWPRRGGSSARPALGPRPAASGRGGAGGGRPVGRVIPPKAEEQAAELLARG